MEIKNKTILGQRYEVLNKIKHGSYCDVYKIRDVSTGTIAAAKVIPDRIIHDRRYREHLTKEYGLVNKLKHNSIIIPLHFHTDTRPRFFLMEYIDWKTLNEVQATLKGKTFPLERALKIIRKVAETVDFAHEKGISHRDLKPQNIFLSENDEVKISDFGIGDEIRTAITRSMNRSITASDSLPYMSPEQVEMMECDGKTDVFSLAVVLYEMLTGQPVVAHTGKEMKKPAKELESVFQLDGRQMRVLNKALSRDKNKRYSSCTEFVNAIEGVRQPGQKLNMKIPLLVGISAILIIGVVIAFFIPRPRSSTDSANNPIPPPIKTPTEKIEVAEIVFPTHTPIQKATGQAEISSATSHTSRFGNLLVKTNPENAKIYLNGIEKGYSPITLENLLPDEYNVKAVLGYQQKTIQVKVNPRVLNRVNLDLEWLVGNMEIITNPPGAEIYIENEKADEVSPANLKGIQAGERYLSVMMEGYSKQTRLVTVNPHQSTKVEFTLFEYTPTPTVTYTPEPTYTPTYTPVPKEWKWEENGEMAVLYLRNGITMEFVLVPAGFFIMGSPGSEKTRNEDESPEHNVNIKSFWIGKYEVTNEQYRTFKIDHNSRNFRDMSLDDPDQPAVYVNWNDATEFCRWLNSNIRGNFRLPSESEWEYACRAGTKTPWHWGDDPHKACEYSNIAGLESKPYLSIYATCDCNDNYVGSSPVGSFNPNDFGLFDMLGNVWEWCYDNHSENYWGAPEDGSVYESRMELRRVYRGGSWEYKMPPPRSALRNSSPPSTKLSTLGFRCVRDK